MGKELFLWLYTYKEEKEGIKVYWLLNSVYYNILRPWCEVLKNCSDRCPNEYIRWVNAIISGIIAIFDNDNFSKALVVLICAFINQWSSEEVRTFVTTNDCLTKLNWDIAMVFDSNCLRIAIRSGIFRIDSLLPFNHQEIFVIVRDPIDSIIPIIRNTQNTCITSKAKSNSCNFRCLQEIWLNRWKDQFSLK